MSAHNHHLLCWQYTPNHAPSASVWAALPKCAPRRAVNMWSPVERFHLQRVFASAPRRQTVHRHHLQPQSTSSLAAVPVLPRAFALFFIFLFFLLLKTALAMWIVGKLNFLWTSDNSQCDLFQCNPFSFCTTALFSFSFVNQQLQQQFCHCRCRQGCSC